MKNIRSREGFSFIEILVVVTIIGIITTIGMVTYTGFMKQSRDAKRKGDLEQIRGALEMYKSKNNVYPTALDLATPGGVCDPLPGTECYLTKLPKDPAATYTYYYSGVADGSTYTLGALLEQAAGSPTTCGDCNKNTPPIKACTYCMGPFGQL